LRRGLVQDETRVLSAREITSLVTMLKKSLQEGSFGCSLGLEYTHARDASIKELQTIGKMVTRKQGVCVVHLRDESEHIMTSIKEAIHIAEETNCRLHISHLKVVGEEYWDFMDKVLSAIEVVQTNKIDVTFDVYPYTMTGTVLYTLLPAWVTEGGKRMMMERLKDPKIQYEIIVELQEKKLDYTQMVILTSPLNHILIHQSIAAIAKNQNKSPEEALLYVLIASGGRAVVSMNVVSAENIRKAIVHPCSIIGTNGSGYAIEYELTEERVHPRSFGTFPLVLSQYVQQEKLLSWEDAIHKMTGKPAKKFGITGRGVLHKGNYADIVVFHPSRIESLATSENPYQYARGMQWILVNGELALDNGIHTKKCAGEVLRKTTSWF
jgi:N-acyl-D-aspartate/D-glutamate deacylase